MENRKLSLGKMWTAISLLMLVGMVFILHSTAQPAMAQGPVPTNTLTGTRTFTPSRTPIPTRTFTITRTFTNTRTPTNTRTVTNTATPTRTITPTFTRTYTRTFTNTYTSTITRTFTRTITLTFTRTSTRTLTPTFTRTPTRTQTFTRTLTPTPTGCVWITSSTASANAITIRVYNPQAFALSLTSASLDWPVATNRYVDYFRFGATTFYPGNSYSSPTTASATPNIAFASHATLNFIVAFGNPGVLTGSFSTTLNFTQGCSITYTMWNGITPTNSPTPTQTRTPTRTPSPLIADLTEKYSRLLYRGPFFGMASQVLSLTVGGDLGGNYSVTLHMDGPTPYSYDIILPPIASGTTTVNSSWPVANINFGCEKEGPWVASFVVTGLSGQTKTSNLVVWGVGYPQVHGSP
jgi:hypothetical protein